MLTLDFELCLGDIVVMTVLPRDIYRCLGQKVAVRTNHPAVWRSNPFIVKNLLPGEKPVGKVVQIGYDVSLSKSGDKHFMHAYVDWLNGCQVLDGIELTELRPCLQERVRSKLVEVTNKYWVICAGNKYDFTAKWWDPVCWRRLDKMWATSPYPPLVQVGETKEAFHQPLKYALNLLDQTTEDELISLICHADGVICGVTAAMHIAAAFNKPCVVVAGSREPWWWDSYDKRMLDRFLPAIQEPYRSGCSYTPHVFLSGDCKYEHCWVKGIDDCKKRVPRNRLNGPSLTMPYCTYAVKPEHVMKAVGLYYEAEGQDVYQS